MGKEEGERKEEKTEQKRGSWERKEEKGRERVERGKRKAETALVLEATPVMGLNCGKQLYFPN